jgi:hypothetical protein
MALTQIARKDGNGTMHRAHVRSVTLGKVEAAEAAGAEIIINTNWQFKGKQFTRVEKLSQTNSRFGGKPKHIIWACYR